VGMGRFDPGPHRFPEDGCRTLALNICCQN
jgi:hypothetical protein